MADMEVAAILREIRSRVRSQHMARHGETNERVEPEPGRFARPSTASTLADLEARLSIVERAKDRLPPLLSNRAGLTARLELWIKRRFGQATGWYTWEQLNFNEAVSGSLRDILVVLSAFEEALARQALATEEIRVDFQTRIAAFESRVEALEEQLRSPTGAHLEQARAETASVLRETAGLRRKLDESIAELRDEQRVIFKQLQLELREVSGRQSAAR